MGYYKNGRYVYDAAEQAATFCNENGQSVKQKSESEIKADERQRIEQRVIDAIKEELNELAENQGVSAAKIAILTALEFAKAAVREAMK